MAENPPLPPGAKKGRRYRRRHAALRAEYEGRSRKHKWLETHIWHAKRTHMAVLWGHRLALRRCDRGARSSHRSVTRACLLHDASYLQCFELTGPREPLSAFLSAALTPFRVYAMEYTAELTIAGRHVGPVRVAVAPGSSDEHMRAWVWIHPACTPEVLGLTPPPDVTLTQLWLNRFELRGVAATRLLRHALVLDESEPNAAIWAALGSPRAADQLPAGAMLAVSAIDPRLFTPSKMPAVDAGAAVTPAHAAQLRKARGDAREGSL
jgi:ribonuclease P/MRP protein subunit POP1